MADSPAAGRGGSFYDEASVTATYLAGRHTPVSSPNLVMEEPAFFEALGDVSGRDIVDLGCGDGTFARQLIERGARSCRGVDGSAAMIAEAGRHANSPLIVFEESDVEDLILGPGDADIVTARMSLHYVSNLAPVFAAVHRGLTQGGRFLFSVVHPVITSHDNPTPEPRTTWTVDRYFHAGPRQRDWFGGTVTWHHRTVEQYVRLVLDNGFDIEDLRECEPRPDLFGADSAELERRRRVPLMLLIAATKRAETP